MRTATTYLSDSTLNNHTRLDGMIYILLWEGKSYTPCAHWNLGQESFKMMGCKYENCYIVDDVKFFKNTTDYDVIIFNSIDLTIDTILPKARTDNQIFIFVSTESSMNYPTHFKFNWFFNITWTYKLNSDIFYPYFITRNERDKIIAPKVDAKWMDLNDMKPTSSSIIDKLNNKTKAAAWFVTNCYASSPRLKYLRNLRAALKNYGEEVDVYGSCDSNKVCIKAIMEDCFTLLESDYYFYLSFENSMTEDYVTEKVMNALDHYTVPVVFGGANYSRYSVTELYNR